MNFAAPPLVSSRYPVGGVGVVTTTDVRVVVMVSEPAVVVIVRVKVAVTGSVR
jgi:hypothetical protein